MALINLLEAELCLVNLDIFISYAIFKLILSLIIHIKQVQHLKYLGPYFSKTVNFLYHLTRKMEEIIFATETLFRFSASKGGVSKVFLKYDIPQFCSAKFHALLEHVVYVSKNLMSIIFFRPSNVTVCFLLVGRTNLPQL